MVGRCPEVDEVDSMLCPCHVEGDGAGIEAAGCGVFATEVLLEVLLGR